LPGSSFGRAQRLLTPQQYRRVFEKPHRFSDRYFTLLARPNGNDVARLGLAIARKRVRLATDRNLLKRLARETFRRHQHELRGLDIVVLARSASTGASRADLAQSLENSWRRVAAIPR
jgi:ribonuclease P protein component